MKEVQVTVYEAFDGSRHGTAQKCREHEASSLPKRLAGLTVEQVQAALDRSDPELAEAFEQVGVAIRNARRKAGDLRRPPVGKTGVHVEGHASPALVIP